MSQQYTLDDLKECRVRIDAIDVQLLNLLNERTKIVERIGTIKRSLTLPIYEPKREDQVLGNVLSHNKGPLEADAIQRVFERIMDEMRTLQRTKMVEAQAAESNSTNSGG
jgi:chorismate mutase